MTMPAALAEVVSEFSEMQEQDKLALLLEFANELPPLPSSLEEAAMVHGNDVDELVAKLNTVFQAK